MRLAADANVLLSALIGGSAKKILRDPQVDEILTTEFTLAEAQEYAGQLAAKKGLAVDVVLLAAGTLPVTIVPATTYRRPMPEARRRVGHRDPDDVELLALALHLEVPIWSNDNDFEQAGVEWFTTAKLLAKLYPR